MRNVTDESCAENQNTHLLFSNFLVFLFENRAFYEIMWKNIVEGAGHRWQYGACELHAGYLRLQKHTHTHTHTEYVILTAFPQRQWLYERTSVLLCVYIACIVIHVILMFKIIAQLV